MLGSGLLAAIPTTPAQATPAVLCFDHDPRIDLNGNGVNDGGPCITSRPPDYSQGDAIVVTLEPQPPFGTNAFISMRCTSGCPAGDPSSTKVYWANYRGSPLTFPVDFVDAGPNNDGGNAVADRAPRYNSTWKATYHIATPIERDLNVWLYNAFEDGNYTVRPGATHRIKAFGFDPGGEVNYKWERRDPSSGRYFPFFAATAHAGTSGPTTGIYQVDFQLPKDEARRIAACGGAVFDCYRIVIGGAGKQQETVNVQVGPAHVRRSEDTTPYQEPNQYPSLQRSTNVTASVDLYYPSGHLRTGPKFFSEDAPISARFGGHALRVAVERFFPGNQTAYLIDDAPMRFDSSRFVWTVQWTIPKDMPIPNDGSRYRLRLVDQRDAYGNFVVNDSLFNFSIEAAEILPRFSESFSELERTREGIVRVAVMYHNGEPVTPSDIHNDTPIRGCFVRIPPPAPPPAPPASPEVTSCSARPNTPILRGTYYDGAWNFSVRYPRGYEDLDAHRFILVNGSRDRYGNDIWNAFTAPYNVVPARPNIEFSTVMRGREAEVLERGNLVFVSATITYHDGTPYNHNVRVNPNSSAATVLPTTLVRRGPGSGTDPYGPIASEEVFNLTESDSSAGRWSGYLQLTDDDTFTPAGIWSWKFDVQDNLTVPNRNVTVFDREVVSTVVQLCPTFHPTGNVATGTSVKFRFRLFYSDCDVGREVPVGAIQSQLTARVYRYDPQTLRPFGFPVSNTIIPAFNGETTGDWSIEYLVPNELYAGAYAFVVTGADTYGNRLEPLARSRPFTTFTAVLERSVITQPPSEVLRGDSATVVFDSREGDTGVDPNRPVPRIQLERFDTASTDCARAAEEGGCWVREIGDVRVPDPTLTDHMGVFPVGVDTPVGLYRFSLQGRDREFHIITGLSTTFGVSATQVSRALLTTPPEQVVKGEAFYFYVESLAGDQVRDRMMFLNGRPLTMPAPLLTHEPGRLNVTWSVPFEAPTGNYTLRLSGRDVNGNVITILSPPIDALPASLEGRVIGQPTKTIERGDVARLQFGVGYPDGSFYASEDTPRVTVVSAAGVTYNAQIRREGLSFAAVWGPPADAPLGEYYFEVNPQSVGGTGNLFPPIRSSAFRLVPGTVVRDPIDDMPVEVERLSSAGYSVPFSADDKFVGFELIYFGPSLSTAIDTTQRPAEITRTPLAHTLDAGAGKYVARVVTDHQTQTGSFQIEMVGEDAYGNAIVSKSRPFVIRPTIIGVIFDTPPPSSQFQEGKSITLSFTARYTIGTLMDDTYGRPSATVLWNGQPVAQRPEITYEGGHWLLTWTAPDILPPGEYTFLVGGADVMGNTIATARSTPYLISEGSLLESANKAIPAPSPLVLVVALAGLAALFSRRRAA